MPLHLTELYCKEGFKRGCELISQAASMLS
jgi:hypothetical protein